MEPAPAQALTPLQVLVDPGQGRARLIGELDMATVANFTEAVGAALGTTRDIILDLSSLTFIDSSGIAAFLDLARGFDGERRLLLEAPRDQVKRVLDLVGARGFSGIVIVDAPGDGSGAHLSGRPRSTVGET